MSDVDLIVLDLDGGPLLEECLASIEHQTMRPATTVVFDNGSRVPVEERLRRRPENAVIARSAENIGFSGGVNESMRFVSARFVGLVNNDVVLEPGWLAALRAIFDRDDRIAAVQSIIRRADGVIDGAGIALVEGMYRQRFNGRPIHEVGNESDVWGVSATAALYRREALEGTSIGGRVLHPAFFAYYEDVELAARLREAGWSAHLVPEVLATHWASSTAESLGTFATRLRVRNRYWVARLHPGTGSVRALIGEDLRRIGGLLRRGWLSEAFRVPSAMAQGLMTLPRFESRGVSILPRDP